jgi:hypothetical protein
VESYRYCTSAVAVRQRKDRSRDSDSKNQASANEVGATRVLLVCMVDADACELT